MESILRFKMDFIRYIAMVFILIFFCFTIFIYFDSMTTYQAPVKILRLERSSTFDLYLKIFNKSYSNEEYQRRLSNFRESMKEISRLNNETGARHGWTKFTDMSKEEFSEMLLTPINLDQYKFIYSNCTPNVNKTIIPTDIPEKVDWRTKGVIGPVVDQLTCGACWAISIVTTMEAMSGIRGLGREQLSIQELFDCSTYNKKCAGGDMSAMDFLCTTEIGITTEEQYPLTFEENRCDWSKTHSGRRLKEYWIQRYMNEDDIQRQIAHHGPVIVVVNSSPWQNYMDGIIQRNCFTSHDGLSLNHMVQVVGYDKTGAIPYYIIKNSWGELFGEKGYVKLAMYKNMCGFSEHVGYLDVY